MLKLDLTERTPEEDTQALKEWMAEIKSTLSLQAFQKSKEFNYDFQKDEPIVCKDARFEWEAVKKDS